MPDLGGPRVTPDAAGCPAEIARQVRGQGGDALLAVKGNPPALQRAVPAAPDRAGDAELAGRGTAASAEDGRGRREGRRVTAIGDPAGLPADWPDVAAVVPAGRERAVSGASASTARAPSPAAAGRRPGRGGRAGGTGGPRATCTGRWARRPGGDASRTRAGRAGANPGLLRRVAASLLKRAGGHGRIQTRRLVAGRDDDFLLTALRGIPAS